MKKWIGLLIVLTLPLLIWSVAHGASCRYCYPNAGGGMSCIYYSAPFCL